MRMQIEARIRRGTGGRHCSLVEGIEVDADGESLCFAPRVDFAVSVIIQIQAHSFVFFPMLSAKDIVGSFETFSTPSTP